MMRILLIVLLLFTGAYIFAQKTANITVNVLNIETANSKLYIGLYNSEKAFKLRLGALDSVIAIPNSISFNTVIQDIPYGNYAIAVFQDINNNNKLDTKKFKIPTEPVGISNYNVSKISVPPTFKKASFYLSSDTIIDVRLINITNLK